ncbi:SHOCT-like domain-containing protein [Clostridium sp.]|uniref:SHOCT-like domain-containing protein n=1 Tax=Clostridium sp. TaxID=1506 RepID=UPI003F4CA183
MNEEMLKILKMVQDGKIDSDKAMQLIEALKGESKDPYILEKTPYNSSSKKNPKMLKIRIRSTENDILNITLPLKFVSGMIRTFGRIPSLNVDGMEGVDIDEMTQSILEAIDGGMDGKIVDIKSGNGDIIEVVIE